jgi:hypothetical protein
MPKTLLCRNFSGRGVVVRPHRWARDGQEILDRAACVLSG